MSRSFGSVLLIGAALTSALGCYMVSLKVSAERAAVDRLRATIVADNRDIRLMQSELRTRARLPELQRWNDSVLTLTPPTERQFVRDSVQLASYAPARAAAPVADVPVMKGAIAPVTTQAPTVPTQLVPRPTLVPGVRQIAYVVQSPARAPLALPEPVAPSHPTAMHGATPANGPAAPVGLDASTVAAVESAGADAAAANSDPARKAPMQ